jgi:hypothetical protein
VTDSEFGVSAAKRSRLDDAGDGQTARVAVGARGRGGGRQRLHQHGQAAGGRAAAAAGERRDLASRKQRVGNAPVVAAGMRAAVAAGMRDILFDKYARK